jgi:hypothetical protein
VRRFGKQGDGVGPEAADSFESGENSQHGQ